MTDDARTALRKLGLIPQGYQRFKNLKLAQAMLEGSWTSRALALAAGVHYETVCRTLNQRTIPKPEIAARLAAALGMSQKECGL